MRLLRLWFLALFSAGWLVPFVLAWNSVLSYLNDDLARLHLATPRPLQSAALVINEALNITHARDMLYVAAGWLALVIFGWTLHALRRPAEAQHAAVPAARVTPVLAAAAESAETTPAEQPVAASADIDGLMAGRLQQFDGQLARLGGLLAQADAERREAAPAAPAPAVDDELRADLKALIGQRLRTLDERLDDVVGLITQAQAERQAVAMAQQPAPTERAAEGADARDELRTAVEALLNQRFAALDERFDGMTSLIGQSDAARAVQSAELASAAAAAAVAAVPAPVITPVADSTLRTDLEHLLQQHFEGLRSQLLDNGASLQQGLDALQSALERVQAAAAAQPAATDVITQTVAANDAKRLKQVVLNLSDLQADLRMLRRKQGNG
ncbi:MAG: hypothetical protein RLY71_3350 [Pseudomonadota bacterium]